MSTAHIALAVGLTAFWGFSFILMRDLLDAFPPLLLAAMRVVAAALPVVVLLRPPRTAWYWLIALGLSQGMVQMSLLLFGMQFGMPAGLSSLILQSQVLFTTLLGYLALRETPGTMQYLGIAISAGGIVLIGFTMPGGGTLIGFAFVIGAAATWSCSNIIVKLAGTGELLRLIAWAHLIGVLPLFALSYVFEGGPEIFTHMARLNGRYVGEIIFLGLISTCFGFMAWGFLLRRYSTHMVAPFSLIIPISGMTSAALILDESFGPMRILGAVVVLLGLGFGMARVRAAPA